MPSLSNAALYEHVKKAQERLDSAETVIAGDHRRLVALEQWAGSFSNASFWGRVRWLLLGR